MIERVKLIRYSTDLLSEEKWTFVFFLTGLHDDERRPSLILDCYEKTERQTKRHKPVTTALWDRLRERDSTTRNPPLPDEVVSDARVKFLARISEELFVGRPKG